MPLLIVAFGVFLLLILIIVFKLNAFLSLIISSLAVGIAEGMPLIDVVNSIQKGIGSTLGFLSLILGLGAMLGKLLADSGGAQKIAEGLIKAFGKKNIQWAVMLTGFIVGIPMFYSVGFVVLVPLVFTVANATRLPLLYIGLPMLASLSVAHGFLPPHPGPSAIALLYNADIGLTLIYGLVISIPAILVGGLLFSKTLKRIKPNPPEKMFNSKVFSEEQLPSFGISIFTGLLPVFLIAFATIMEIVLPSGSLLLNLFSFIGDPVIALLLSVLLAIYTLGLRRKMEMKAIMKVFEESIASIAMILLVIGGAGAFKEVLVDSGVSEYISELLKDMTISPLVLVWGIAGIIRVSVGSATVAGLTTAGIALPIIATTNVSPELMVLATGAGSLMLSHVNDPGFWMFKEYFGLSIRDTIRSWSSMETIVSVVGLLGVLVLNQFI